MKDKKQGLGEDQRFDLVSQNEDIEPTAVAFYDSLFKECGHEIKYFGGKPRTDGSIRNTKMDVGFEFKSDEIDLKKEKNQLTAEVQILMYIKDLKDKGIPNYSKWCIGNTRRCLIMNGDCFEKYLNENYINWDPPASTAYKRNSILLDKFEKDLSIKPEVIINNDYDTFKKSIIDKLSSEYKTIKKIIDSTSDLIIAFDYWINNVVDELKDDLKDEEKHLAMFYESIYLKGNISKQGDILTNNKGDIVSIRNKQYYKFFDLYDKVDENNIGKLLEQKDVLVEKIRKAERGINYTPVEIAKEGRELIREHLGDDCFKRIPWMDVGCATGNLTKEEQYERLYQCDYYEENIDILENHKINYGSIKFQFDYVNDLISKAPKQLQDDLNSDSPFGIDHNSPFKSKDTGNFGNYIPIPESRIRNEMKKSGKFSKGSYDEYWAQFIYRDIKLLEKKRISYIAMYTPSNFLTHAGYSSIRNFLHESGYIYKGGFIVNAKYFGATDTFYILRSFWAKENGNNPVEIPSTYKVKEKNIVKINGKDIVKTLEEEKILKAKEETIWKWLKDIEIDGKRIKLPAASSGLNFNLKDIKSMQIPYITNFCCATEDRGAFLLSTPQKSNTGVRVTKENFRKSIALFSVLNINKNTHKVKKGSISVPDETLLKENKKYEQFVYDSHIYTAFVNSNNNSSFKITKVNKGYDIRNELFPFSIKDMINLAIVDEKELESDKNFNKMINDINSEVLLDTGYKTTFNSKESYMYIQLENLIINKRLSDDAIEIYVLAKNLLIKSFKYRKSFDKQHPKLYLFRWDAGWFQIRQLLDKICKTNSEIREDYKIFNDKFNKFEQRLSKDLYEFGFLLK